MAQYASLLSKAWDVTKKAYQTVSAASRKSPYDVIPVEASELHRNYRVVKETPGSAFSVFQEISGQQSFLVLYRVPGTLKYLSIYRAYGHQRQDVLNVASIFEEQAFLFGLIGDNQSSIEELVQAVHEHPNWMSIHYASLLNLQRYFTTVSEDPNITQLLYAACFPENFFPLHVACQSGSVESAKALVSLGSSPVKTDPNGLNALHFATKNNGAAMIDYLATVPEFANCAEATTGSGYTPLFLAIQFKNYAVVEALLRHDVNIEQVCNGKTPYQEALDLMDDDQGLSCLKMILQKRPQSIVEPLSETGNTLLHQPLKKQELSGLLEKSTGLNLDVANKLGKTPLHCAVTAGNLEATVLLLAHGCNPNCGDLHGNTSMHLAMLALFKDIMKALFVFGGDPCLTNKNGISCLDMLAKADKKLEQEMRAVVFGESNRSILPGSSSVQSQTVEQFAQMVALSECSKRQKESRSRLWNLLTLDGGGIRGLILIQILAVLERRLGRPVFPHFDWVAGTSTGAILAVALSLGKTLEQCRQLYFRFKDTVFCGMRPYDTGALEGFLKEEIGEVTSIQDVKNVRLTITGVKADRHPVELVIFRNYTTVLSEMENRALGFENPFNELWKCVRCSSAAPTYFSSVDGTYMDGGIISNNPTLDLLSELHTCNTAAHYAGKEERIEVGCVVSAGTGRIPQRPMQNIDVLGLSNGVFGALANAFVARDLGTVLIDQVTATEGRPVDRSRSWCHSMGVPFFRFSTDLSRDIPLDETNDLILVNMLWETELYMASHKNDVQSLIDYFNSVLTETGFS